MTNRYEVQYLNEGKWIPATKQVPNSLTGTRTVKARFITEFDAKFFMEQLVNIEHADKPVRVINIKSGRVIDSLNMEKVV